jgi:ubiquinone/menaquinone biosynthesis C-methylase UbiE
MFIQKTASRKQQAEKIFAILADFLQTHSFKPYLCLEVGCGSGEICKYFAIHVNLMWGIEIDYNQLKIGAITTKTNLAFSQADGSMLPFQDSTFDLILFPQVYEHTLNQQGIFNEIHRVLNPGGICFFSGPNRYRIIEPHYFLPFLSWLPNRLATYYLRLSKRGEIYDIYPRSYWTLKKLTKGFQKYDYTYKMIKYPEKFKVTGRLYKLKFNLLPTWILRIIEPFYPNFNWILKKDSDK